MSERPSSKTPKSPSKTPKPKPKPMSKPSVRVPASAAASKNFKALPKMSPIGEEDSALEEGDDDGFEQFRGVGHSSKQLVKSSAPGGGSKMPASGDTFADDKLKQPKGKGKGKEKEKEKRKGKGKEKEKKPELDFDFDDLEFGFGYDFVPESLSGKPTSVMPHSDDFRDKPSQLQLQQSSAMPPSNAFADPKQKMKADPETESETTTELPTPGDFKPASILRSREDQVRAQIQLYFSTLRPSLVEAQKSWAVNLIQRSGACPEQYEWLRMDATADGQSEGGFICAGGRHGVLDSMIELGTGGIFCLNSHSSSSTAWATAPKYGPYFRHPTIRNVWVEIEKPQRLTLPGLRFCTRKVLFLGAENQVARAKWEFFDIYPGLGDFYRYVRPEREPPVECRYDKKNLIEW
ncbi:hypothetical protein LZ554_005491 [Drepanopeziza brunnea f. sp. 'monogermtubi']|nr:hypothetical protein LZ554_005491 [Drepanopeziza brunnea f. sp. 'monogermtubi']